jgi:alpha-methylacyl-CoA racemase
MLLDGIRVLDFTRLLPGPYATLRLADLGAKVIKVEEPYDGDPARAIGRRVGGAGAVFLANARNKQSVILDLKTEEGRAAALHLAAKVDVVMEGFRPGVAARLGIDYESVRAVNPRVVYCSLTGYGQTGPWRQRAGHDVNYLAASGVLAQLTDTTGRPILSSLNIGDLIGGLMASEAVVAALFCRERSGEGRYLDIAMTDALLGLMQNHALIQAATGEEHAVKELTGQIVCYNVYQTKDGRYVSLAALEPKFWSAFCRAVERPDWQSTAFTDACEENPVYREVQALFADRTLVEWAEFADRVDCCLQPVLEVSEAIASPHARARDISVDLETEAWGRLRMVSTHAGGFTSAAKRPPIQAPPRLGEHTHQVVAGEV